MASPLSPSAAAAPASILVQEASLVFHGTRYVLSLRSVAGSAARAPALLLSAWADDGSGGTWSASFSAQEIEQMTAKTGEFQPFVSLERMLGRALAAAEATDNGAREPHIIRHQHGAHFDTLQIDCLTYEQLDALKARRSASSGSSQTPRSQARRSLNKRYVILSLSHSEAPEERIHYPLPLPFKGNNREPPGREEDSSSADIADANGARTSQLQHALSTDVAALRSQIAKLTHSVHNEQANQAAQQQLQQARERERDRDRERERDRDRDRHSRSSRSHKPHSNKPPFIDDDSPRLHATRADRLASENAQLRSELAQLRDLAKLGPQSPSGASHSALKNLPRRPGAPHHIKGDDESREFDLAEVDLPTAAWQGSEAERLKRVAALEAASAHAASRTIEASEELIESLQRRLEQAREAAQFEAEVAAKRIAGLEAENRLLRRSEAAALARLAKADEDMLAVTQEARMLKERVEEYMVTTNTNARTGARRGRSTTPVANRTNAAQSSSSARARAPSPGRGGGGSALPPLRGASASPSRRAPSPYLSGSGSGRASPGRGASPVVSGRSTPIRGGGGGGGGTSSHARSASPSYMQPMARSASARSPAPVPPLPLRARSRSPTPQRSNGVGAAGLSPSSSSQRTAPLERSYTQWQVNSHEVKMPLKRFDPSMYIERRKQQLAQKAAQRYERIEGEITASPSSALRGSSPLRRSTLGMSASVPAFSFVQSPGRAARSGAEGRPNGYVDPRGAAASPSASQRAQQGSSRSTRSRSPSLSRSASLGPDSFAQTQPATAQPSSPSNDRLGHTKPVPGAQAADVLFTTVRTAVAPPPPGSGPLDDADNDPVARAARAAFREARTRELQLAQEEERARERARKMDAQLGLPADELSRVYASENARARAQVLNEPRHAWEAAERARQRALEPNIPRVELLDLGSDAGREPARDNQQLGALTQRLAKLQSYLAAEKQA
jgi:hypothetical protein